MELLIGITNMHTIILMNFCTIID